MKAKRRINSTGRKRINHSNIDIRLAEAQTGPLRASATLDLAAYNFPAAASVSIEAYHRSSGMRFDCGTVGQPAIPKEMVLDQIDQSGSVLFRVKVTESEGETGRILGSAERIQPFSGDDDKNRRSFFPVKYRDLGEQTWKVDISPDSRPILMFNREIPEIAHRVAHDTFLQGLVFPAAFRVVIEALALGSHEDEQDEETGEAGWQAEWLQFCSDSLGISEKIPKSDDEAVQGWINDAVDRFCSAFGFMNRIRQSESKKEEEAA